MKQAPDLTGLQFEEWTVLERAGKNFRGNTLWHCRCSCGVERNVIGSRLTGGYSRSCGHKTAKITHHCSNDRLYKIWSNMRDRCNNPKCHDYGRYGGRGITVCDEWQHDFGAFRDWALSAGYDYNAEQGQCTLDRIDNNKGYSPNNCAWKSMHEQTRNQSTNRYIEYNGERKIIADWARIYNINPSTLRNRVFKLHWNIETALTKPVEHSNSIKMAI